MTKMRGRTNYITSLLNKEGLMVDYNLGLQDTMINYLTDIFKTSDTE